MRTTPSNLLPAVLIATLATALTAFAMQTGQPAAPASGPMETRIDPDQQKRLQQFEAQLEALRKEHHIPGLSVAIVKDQEVLYLKGLGSATDGRPATPDSSYPLRSLNRISGKPWTVRELANLDVVLDRGGIPEIRPYLTWHREDSGGTRLQWASEHEEKAGSVLYLKVPERRLTLILLANGEGLWWRRPLGKAKVEESPFAAAFLKAFS